MKRRSSDAALGAIAIGAIAIALPAGLRCASGEKDLRVTVRSPEPFEIAPRTRAESLAPAMVGPPSLLPRLELGGAPDRDDPGVWLRTWQITYGKRWERQVTFPVLAGPFDPEGKPWPCAIAARLSPRFFDDDKRGGDDVGAVIDRVVRSQFPFSVMGLRFAPVARTALRVKLVDGGVDVSGSVTLADGARDPTHFTLRTKIALGERGGDLAARIENVSVDWRGRTRRDPLVELASLFLDVDDQARKIVAGKLSAALAIFKLPKDPIAIFPDRPGDRFTLRLCDAPDARADGLTVRLRLVASLAEPRTNAAIPGPPHLEAMPALPPPAPDAPTFEAVASAAAVQQALYAMWQGGALTAWGSDPRVLRAMRDKLGDRLDFELGSIDPRLPPAVVPDPSSLRVRFAALDVGRAGARRVWASSDVIAKARVEGDRVGLSGTLADLRVTCAESRAGEHRFTPCFSDVVPALRDSGVTSEGLPLDLAVPDRLLRMSLVLGTDLVLRGVEGELSGSSLRLRGDARLVPKNKP